MLPGAAPKLPTIFQASETWLLLTKAWLPTTSPHNQGLVPLTEIFLAARTKKDRTVACC